MAELCCERRVLRRSCEAKERFELWVEPREGAIVFGEDSQGPLTEMAFGEEWHRSMVRVEAAVLLRACGVEEAEKFLVASDAPLCDLMDLLDGQGAPYSYMGVGNGGAVSLRGECLR